MVILAVASRLVAVFCPRTAISGVSAATVRNIVADLEDAGLIFAPHTSAGRLPTELGLRLFVDGLMEVGNLSREDRNSIEAMSAGAGRTWTKCCLRRRRRLPD